MHGAIERCASPTRKKLLGSSKPARFDRLLASLASQGRRSTQIPKARRNVEGVSPAQVCHLISNIWRSQKVFECQRYCEETFLLFLHFPGRPYYFSRHFAVGPTTYEGTNDAANKNHPSNSKVVVGDMGSLSAGGWWAGSPMLQAPQLLGQREPSFWRSRRCELAFPPKVDSVLAL